MKVQFVKSIAICVGGAIYPTDFRKSDEPIEVDEETAELAIKEGWAKPVDPTPVQRGPQSHGSGMVEPSASSEPGPVLPKSKSKRSKANAKR